jgi:catechol 2,3-dioxygenase-like lactoylglutathione lyase family enzyme
MLTGIDHVQLTIPPGAEHLATARAFYAGALGLDEVEKPEELRERGGIWFRGAGFEVHLGVEAPAETRRHPGFLTNDLAAVRARLAAAGVVFEEQPPLGDRERVHLRDPFGNRIEILQRHGAETTGGDETETAAGAAI